MALPLLLTRAALLLLALWVVQGARLAILVAIAGGALLWLRDRAHGGRGGHSARYQAVMRSTGWRRRRSRALRAAGRRCQECDAAGPLDVHHLSYAHLGDERPYELAVLCKRCHSRLHGR